MLVAAAPRRTSTHPSSSRTVLYPCRTVHTYITYLGSCRYPRPPASQQSHPLLPSSPSPSIPPPFPILQPASPPFLPSLHPIRIHIHIHPAIPSHPFPSPPWVPTLPANLPACLPPPTPTLPLALPPLRLPCPALPCRTQAYRVRTSYLSLARAPSLCVCEHRRRRRRSKRHSTSSATLPSTSKYHHAPFTSLIHCCHHHHLRDHHHHHTTTHCVSPPTFGQGPQHPRRQSTSRTRPSPGLQSINRHGALPSARVSGLRDTRPVSTPSSLSCPALSRSSCVARVTSSSYRVLSLRRETSNTGIASSRCCSRAPCESHRRRRRLCVCCAAPQPRCDCRSPSTFVRTRARAARVGAPATGKSITPVVSFVSSCVSSSRCIHAFLARASLCSSLSAARPSFSLPASPRPCVLASKSARRGSVMFVAPASPSLCRLTRGVWALGAGHLGRAVSPSLL